MEVEHSLFSAPSAAETCKGLNGVAGWAWGVVPVFGPDGREKQGGGVGSRKGPGKRGPRREGVRRGLRLLGVGFKEDAGGNGDGTGSRRAKHWLVHVLAPLDRIMSGDLSGMEV